MRPLTGFGFKPGRNSTKESDVTKQSTEELDFTNWTKEGTTVVTENFRIVQTLKNVAHSSTAGDIGISMENNARLLVVAPRMFELCLKLADERTEYDELVPIAEELIAAVLGENDHDIDDPKWTEARPRHDWRNHVAISVRKLWSTFTHAQKIALRNQATDLADREEYE